MRSGAVSLLALGLAGCVGLERWYADLRVPNPEAREAYAEPGGGSSFDPSAFDEVLGAIVDDAGRVDYEALLRDPSALDGFLAQLASLDFSALSRDHKLATLINAYNAFTLRLILDHWPLQSIKDIPSEERWQAARWQLGDRTLSLDEIEHRELRAKFLEPRIHFAINCASESCPPLLESAYRGERIDAQLDRAAGIVHDPDRRWFDFDPKTGDVSLFRVYLWFHRDFERSADSVVDFAARFHAPLRSRLKSGGEVDVSYLEYDWSLNRSRPVTE